MSINERSRGQDGDDVTARIDPRWMSIHAKLERGEKTALKSGHSLTL